MSSSEPTATSKAELPPDHEEQAARAAEPATQESDDLEQVQFDSEDFQDSEQAERTQTLPEQSASNTHTELPAASPHQDTPVEAQSNHDEIQHASDGQDQADDDNDDGDISLIASPRADTAASFASSSHRRIDSVPPQKYHVTQDATHALSASLASTSLHSTIQEEESDISIPQYDDSQDPQLSAHSASAFRSHFLPSHHDEPEALHSPTSIDKADLNFVDITLDGPADESTLSGNLLEPPNPLAGSTRTADQIRRDSVSSQMPQTSTSAAASQEHNSAPPAPVVQVSGLDLHPPPNPNRVDLDVDDNAIGNRSVEGRYRGRTSAASSRAASPTRSPSPSPSHRTSFAPAQTSASPLSTASNSFQNGLSITPAPVLLAADEHGNISVVSDVPVSPRTVPDALPQKEAGDENQQSAGAEDVKPSDAPAPKDPAEVAQQRAPTQNGRAATSLSDEVQAADAAESSAPPASEKSDTTSSSLAPPDAGQHNSSTSPGLSDKADQVDSKKRRKSSSAGADQVESRTRMTTLPAKTKTEEIKHRADFERMMMAAKEVERKKREEEEERKRRRQDEQREALGRWEKEILPSWSRARKDPELGQLWWKGAPPSIRGRVWALAIGNPLMLPRNLLEQSEKRAAGTIPPRVLDQIDEDVEDTLPSLKLFQANGPLHDDLIRLCRAFVLVRMEQVAELDLAGDADKAASRHQNASPLSRKADLPSISGVAQPGTTTEGAPDEQDDYDDEYAQRGIDLYQPGLASLAAVLLINMSINTAFIALLNLLHSKPWLKALYSLLPTVVPAAASSKMPNLASATRKPAYALPPKEKQIRGFERVLETLLADQMPKVYANLLARNVKLYRVVLRDWVSTLWSKWLDVDTVMRLWDVVLLDETDSLIYRVCLALVQTLESRLYVPDQEELESILKGTNKAALAIWRRDKEIRGELEVHAQRSLAAPRHSRSSISATSVAPQQQISEATTPPTAASNISLASGASSEDPQPPIATPPPRSSSLAQYRQSQSQSQLEPPPPHTEEASIDFEEIVPRDYIYEQYAIKEENVFDTLEAQQTWWKQSTLQRLLDRELSE
ncbi:uncharacterized protein UTRI_04073_B [Ustilago trichophora]|uniref:Rab-GAP TBC domain-containing protein n=1 Tax=Ustilago trichophora TaxID=86804 RepID=A0A5C3E7Q2_9BASI|nr:uncharacterized protein UTRI_04073_B [Ustilago trichophora]